MMIGIGAAAALAAPPAAPGNLTAVPQAATTIRVTWTSSPEATRYSIQRKSGWDAAYAQIATTAHMSYDDTTVNGSTKYWYQVKAQNDSGSSPPSNWDSATAGSRRKLFPRGIVYCHFGATTAAGINNKLGPFLAEHTWIKGMAVICRWKDLEPTAQGDYDWSALDAAQAVAHARNIPLLLIFKTGEGPGYTPLWIISPPNAANKFTGKNRPLVTTKNGEHNLVPWDALVRNCWLATLANIASHTTKFGAFGDDELIAGIYVAGCNAQYPEMIMPGDTRWSSSAFCSPPGTDPPNQAYDPEGIVYSAAWQKAIEGYAGAANGRWRTTWFINMLDELNAVAPQAVDLTAPRAAITRFIEANDTLGFTHCTLGTANMGYWNNINHVVGNEIDLERPKYAALRDSTVKSPVYYEIGPRKMDAVAGHLSTTLTNARNILGCKAVILFNSVLERNPAFIEEAKTANARLWGIR